MRSFMTQYSYSSDDEAANSAQLTYYRNITRLFPQQKLFPRIYWIRRAGFYNTARSRLNSFHRSRTEIDDRFIAFVVEMCLSNYVGIRKTAQASLETIAAHYDGTKELCIPTLLEAIQPGTGDDRMKGALYVLGSKGFSNFAIVDPRFTVRYVTALLAAQHHPKPSIQKLVRGILGDFVIRFAEPSSLRHKVDLPAELEEAADILEASLPEDKRAPDEQLLAKVREVQRKRVALADQMSIDLETEVLKIATSKETHWSFALHAARLLRIILRRDKPLSDKLVAYFAQEVVSDNPQIRRSAAIGLVKALLLLKLRTMCKSDVDLLLMRSTNPLKQLDKLDLPVSEQFTEQYFQEFGAALSPDSKLRDKTSQGWLVWSDESTYYKPSTEGEGVPFVWDESSKGAVEAIQAIVTDGAWWERIFTDLSQEKSRNYIGAETINLIKSIFQVRDPRHGDEYGRC